MIKKFLVITVLISLAFSPLLHAPQAHAQTQKVIEQVVKRYGVYIGITAAVAIVASVCAVVHTPLSSPVGDTCAAIHKGVSDFIDKHQTTFDKIEAFLKDIALQILKRRILDKMVDQIVNWIQGGGNPQFVQDWKGFLSNAGQAAVGDVISDSGLAFLCSPFKAQLKIALRGGGGLSPFPVKDFSHGVACTLDKIVGNIDSFYKDFRTGGWIAYSASWEPQNNFYGAALISLDVANQKIAEAEANASAEAQGGNGFLPQKVCNITYRDRNGKSFGTKANVSEQKADEMIKGSEIAAQEDNSGVTVTKDCKTTTPGNVVGNLVTKAVGADFDYILNANDLSTYASAITNALVNRLMKEGSGGLVKIGKQSDPANAAYSSDDPNSVVTLPKDLIQGGECIVEDDPTTVDDPSTPDIDENIDESKDDPKTKNIKENEGAYIVDNNQWTCLSLLPKAGPALSADSMHKRKEMIDKYRQVLQHTEWLLALKIKTKRHYTSLIRVVRTMNNLFKDRPGEPNDGPADIKCKDGSDFNGSGSHSEYGTQFNLFKGMDSKFRLLGVKMGIIPSGEAPKKLDYQDIMETLDKDIENLPRLIDEVSNRLNILQAPAGVYEERPFLHSVFTGDEQEEAGAPSTSDLALRLSISDLITTTPRKAFDPIITPFHLYGDIGLGNLGQEVGKPVLIEERPTSTEEPSLIGIATGVNPNAPIRLSEETDDGDDTGEDGEVSDIPRSFLVPTIKPLPNVRRVTISQKSLIRNKFPQLKSSFLRASLFGVVGGQALERQALSSQQSGQTLSSQQSSVQQSTLQQSAVTSLQTAFLFQPDEKVYGKTALNNNQIDALHKSFIKFSLEHMALFTIYTNESNKAFELDLKQEEYRARQLHYWLFTRNLYTPAEYNVGAGSIPVARGKVVQNDLNEYLAIMSSTMDEINSAPTETGGRVLADERTQKRNAERAALEGAIAGYIASGGNPIGAVVGAVGGFFGGGGSNVSTPTDSSGKITGGGLVGRTTVDLQNKLESEFLSDVPETHRPAQYVKVGLFTWCTGYPIFNPELF